MDPNGVQITWNFAGASFSTEQDFGEKEVQQRKSEEEMCMDHVARCLGHVGPTHSHLIAPMPLIFISMDSSWPKTIYQKGHPAGREKERRQNTETQIEAWEIEGWRGKLWRDTVGVISIPSNDSTFVTMMKRE
jgi:hypothetical protein